MFIEPAVAGSPEAISIAAVTDLLASSSVSANVNGDYASHLSAGIALEAARHCRAALTEFRAAASMNARFGGTSAYLAPHVTACEALIASGRSLDTTWDYVREWAIGKGLLFWLVMLAAVMAAGGSAVAISSYLRRTRRARMRMREREAQKRAEETLAQGEPKPIVLEPSEPVYRLHESGLEHGSAEVPTRELVSYVESARKDGLSEVRIRAALLDAGWGADVVNRVLRQ